MLSLLKYLKQTALALDFPDKPNLFERSTAFGPSLKVEQCVVFLCVWEIQIRESSADLLSCDLEKLFVYTALSFCWNPSLFPPPVSVHLIIS